MQDLCGDQQAPARPAQNGRRNLRKQNLATCSANAFEWHAVTNLLVQSSPTPLRLGLAMQGWFVWCQDVSSMCIPFLTAMALEAKMKETAVAAPGAELSVDSATPAREPERRIEVIVMEMHFG